MCLDAQVMPIAHAEANVIVIHAGRKYDAATTKNVREADAPTGSAEENIAPNSMPASATKLRPAITSAFTPNRIKPIHSSCSAQNAAHAIHSETGMSSGSLSYWKIVSSVTSTSTPGFT